MSFCIINVWAIEHPWKFTRSCHDRVVGCKLSSPFGATSYSTADIRCFCAIKYLGELCGHCGGQSAKSAMYCHSALDAQLQLTPGSCSVSWISGWQNVALMQSRNLARWSLLSKLLNSSALCCSWSMSNRGYSSWCPSSSSHGSGILLIAMVCSQVC